MGLNPLEPFIEAETYYDQEGRDDKSGVDRIGTATIELDQRNLDEIERAQPDGEGADDAEPIPEQALEIIEGSMRNKIGQGKGNPDDKRYGQGNLTPHRMCSPS